MTSELSELVRHLEIEVARQRNVAQEGGVLLGRIRGALRAGQTTGDPIRDALLFREGRVDERRLRSYERINTQLSGNVGKLMLLIYQAQVTVKHTFTGEGNKYDRRPRGVLGVLDGNHLLSALHLAPSNLLRIPTSKYVALATGARVEDGALFEASPALEWNGFLDSYGNLAIQLYVGEEAILRNSLWAGGELSIKSVARAARKLEAPSLCAGESIRRFAERDALDAMSKLHTLRRMAVNTRLEIVLIEQAKQGVGVYSPDGLTTVPFNDEGGTARYERALEQAHRRLAQISHNVAEVLSKSTAVDLRPWEDERIVRWARAFVAK